MLKSRPVGLPARLRSRAICRSGISRARSRTNELSSGIVRRCFPIRSLSVECGRRIISMWWSIDRASSVLDTRSYSKAFLRIAAPYISGTRRARDLLDRLALDEVLTPIRHNGLHDRHPSSTRPESEKRTRSTCWGQFFSNDTQPNARCRLPI
jgi:hypothetical protein